MKHPPEENDTRYRSTGIVIHLLSEQDLLRVLPDLVLAEAAADQSGGTVCISYSLWWRRLSRRC